MASQAENARNVAEKLTNVQSASTTTTISTAFQVACMLLVTGMPAPRMLPSFKKSNLKPLMPYQSRKLKNCYHEYSSPEREDGGGLYGKARHVCKQNLGLHPKILYSTITTLPLDGDQRVPLSQFW